MHQQTGEREHAKQSFTNIMYCVQHVMHALQLEVVAVWAFSNTPVHAKVRQQPTDNSIQLQVKLQTCRTRQQSF
jgi:hypothetical protein